MLASSLTGCFASNGAPDEATTSSSLLVEVTQRTVGADPTTGTAATVESLDGTTYQTFAHHGGEVVRIEVRFSSGFVTVATPACRTEQAPFRIDGDRLLLGAAFDRPVVDGQQCPATLRALHDRVIDLVAGSPVARVHANALYLVTTNRTLVLLLS